jgi:hypothetical protein
MREVYSTHDATTTLLLDGVLLRQFVGKIRVEMADMAVAEAINVTIDALANTSHHHQ